MPTNIGRPSLRRFVVVNAGIVVAMLAFLIIGPGGGHSPPLGAWPIGWAFGAPVEVDLASSCETITVLRRGSVVGSTAECPGATWQVAAREVTGTLLADNADVTGGWDEPLRMTGPVRAYGDRAYGYPGNGRLLWAFAPYLGIILGVVSLAAGGAMAAVRSVRRRRAPEVTEPEPPTVAGVGPMLSVHRSFYGYTWILWTEFGLLGLLTGVALVTLGHRHVGLLDLVLTLGGAATAVVGLVRFVQRKRQAGSAVTLVGHDGVAVLRDRIVFTAEWTAARFVGIPTQLDREAAVTNFALMNASGGEHRFGREDWTDFTSLRAHAASLSERHAWPRLLAEFNAGRDVTFGQITVNRNGIRDRNGGVLPWGEISRLERVKDSDGIIFRQRPSAGGWRDGSVSLHMRKTPDVGLLMHIANAQIELARVGG